MLKGSLQIDNMDKNVYCETRQRAKQTIEPFSLSDHVSKSLGDLVHLDLWGPYQVTSSEGFRYFLTVVDNFTRAVWVYLIKSKDEVPHLITIFCNLIENQFKRKIKVFRSDNRTEFVNQIVNSFYAEKGIIHQTSCAYTPQQNGIAERKHKHLLNMPNDDERVDPNLNSDNKSQSASSSSSESGRDANTADVSVNSENDADSKLLKGRKVIRSKWIFKIKYQSSGEIDRFKARLVAHGFGQKEGIDYEETFSHVVMVTVRCLLNVVVSNSWPVFQLDVNNAFLYGDLDEIVYMKPPEGYFPSGNKVRRLKKSLYGLKQAPKQWNAKLTSTLIENGFSQSKFDYSLYTKYDKGVFLDLLVYMDDIIK
ncbi:ribonuclease H-like domain-containing protein [Tanacetum coccineum]